MKNNSKALITTDTYHKDGAPHLMVTAIDCNVNDREEKYNDIAGFIKYKPKANDITKKDIQEMDDWADILNKNIIFLLRTNKKLSGWLFEYGKDITYREIQVYTVNDVNYDIWLDPDINFWNPVDFLLEAEYYGPMLDQETDEKLTNIQNGITQLSDKISEFMDSVKKIIERKNNENI